MKIIDVSVYNGTIDWKKVKKYGCDGAIIKIIRKDLGKDKKFEENYKKCEKLGIPWGVYNYTYATTTAKAKSDMKLVCDILDKVSKKHFKYGVWFDIEDKVQARLKLLRLSTQHRLLLSQEGINSAFTLANHTLRSILIKTKLTVKTGGLHVITKAITAWRLRQHQTNLISLQM